MTSACTSRTMGMVFHPPTPMVASTKLCCTYQLVQEMSINRPPRWEFTGLIFSTEGHCSCISACLDKGQNQPAMVDFSCSRANNDIQLCRINWNPTGSLLETSSHTVGKTHNCATKSGSSYGMSIRGLFWEQRLCSVAVKNMNDHLGELFLWHLNMV